MTAFRICCRRSSPIRKKAVVALKWAVREMEERYRKMSKLGVRGVEAFNDRVRKAKDKGETLKRTVQTGFDRETGKPIYEDEVLELEPMPYIVVVVDEMADLMMISGKEIEGAVQRLAQMARAAGIHLIAATQRPSVDVITGTIKANFPTRISFQVTIKIDSRTILGEQGAEQLLGQGDMLYMMAGGRIRRVHGPFVSDHEVEDVVRFLKTPGRAGISRRRDRGSRTTTATIPMASSAAATAIRATISTTRRSPSWRATARPRPATSSAACRSATTAPPPDRAHGRGRRDLQAQPQGPARSAAAGPRGIGATERPTPQSPVSPDQGHRQSRGREARRGTHPLGRNPNRSRFGTIPLSLRVRRAHAGGRTGT